MRLALGDQLRLEAAGAVAWDRNLQLAILGQHRLRACAVAAIAAATAGGVALLVAEVFGQLRPKRALNQGSLELFEKPVFAGQVLRLLIVRKQSIKQFRGNRRTSRHVSLPSKVNSQKPTYTTFLTVSAFLLIMGTSRIPPLTA